MCGFDQVASAYFLFDIDFSFDNTHIFPHTNFPSPIFSLSLNLNKFIDYDWKLFIQETHEKCKKQIEEDEDDDDDESWRKDIPLINA